MAGAKLWSTGPVAAFIKHALDAQATFLGHGEQAPDIREHAAYKDVHTDLSGPAEPHDKQYQGHGVKITMTLGRFDQAGLNVLRSHGRHAHSSAITPGIDPPGSMGGLVVAEGMYFSLWLAFYFSAKAAYQGMPPGYHFHHCVLDNYEEVVGTKDIRKCPLSISTVRRFAAGDSTSAGFGSWSAFDHDMTGINGIAIS